MSTRQVLRQFEYLSKNLLWDGGGKVFGDAVATVAQVSDLIRIIDDALIYPFISFRYIRGTLHKESPLLREATFEVSIIVNVENDYRGRIAAVGGHQKFTEERSSFKGITELQEKFYSSILGKIGRESGIQFQLLSTSEHLEGGIFKDSVAGAALFIDVSAIIYEKSTYSPSYNSSAVQIANDVKIAWVDAVDRYDRIKNNGVRIARKAGSNPSVTDEIAKVDIGVLSYTDLAPAAGTYTYGVFQAYDETNNTPSVVDKYSDGSFITITVT